MLKIIYLTNVIFKHDIFDSMKFHWDNINLKPRPIDGTFHPRFFDLKHLVFQFFHIIWICKKVKDTAASNIIT